MAVENESSSRLLLVDGFRTICAVFIVIYHVWMVFYNLDTTFETPYPFFRGIEHTQAFLFFYSGVWIACISFFLFGFKNAKLPVWRLFLCVVGWVLLQHVGPEDHDFFSPSSYTWGVFAFIFVGYSVILILQRLPKRVELVALSFLSLIAFVPHSLYRSFLGGLPSVFWQEAFVGIKQYGAATGWFLFPWIGIVFLSYFMGKLINSFPEFFRKIRWYFDLPLVALLLGSLALHLNTASPMKLGPTFNQAVFWLEPQELLYIIALPMVIFRFAVAAEVQKVLSKSKFMNWVSNLFWNRKFWLCYVIHFSFLVTVQVFFSNYVYEIPFLMQTLWLILFVLTDIFARGFYRSQTQLRFGLFRAKPA